MSTIESTPTASGRPPSRWAEHSALGSLFLAAFVVGCAELVVVGVLPLVAEDLGVSEGTAGTLVSSYAIGIALGGPILTFVTMSLPRRAMLRTAFTLYVLGNVGAALSASFGLLVVARLVTGSLHGMFIGLSLGAAATIVPPERMGRAISLVLGGIAVSTAFGVPVGTLIGQSMGWRASFAAIVIVGAVALIGVFAFVPRTTITGTSRMWDQAHHALAPRVLFMLLTGFLVMGGQFAALTFITPFLEQVTGVSSGSISLFLLVFGIASAVGTLAGGRLADINANATLVACTLVVVLSFALIYLGRTSVTLVIVGLVVWGVAGFGLVPSFQYRVVGLSGPGRDFAATLPASASTGGIAIGSLLGGIGLSTYGPTAPILVAGIACLVVLPLMYLTTRLRLPEDAGEPAAGASAALEDIVVPTPAADSKTA